MPYSGPMRGLGQNMIMLLGALVLSGCSGYRAPAISVTEVALTEATDDAVALAYLPIIAYLLFIHAKGIYGPQVSSLTGKAAADFNSASEAAVVDFLAGGIEFVTIVELIEHCLNKHDVKAGASIEELLEADAWARKEVRVKVHKSPSKAG